MEDRKNSHLTICLEDTVEFADNNANGLASYRFDHDALPELSRREISLETTIFGKRLAAPILVGAMTGGTERAAEVNRRLAIAAEACGIGMALGSQRKMLESPASRSSYSVRHVAPKLPLLLGNIGAVQFNYGVGLKELRVLVESVGCDAFNFHLNPLQEAIQPEGDTDFSNLLSKISEYAPKLGVPVLLKEVGSGISETTALKIKDLPIAGVETAGLGGTSWSKIESLRTTDSIQRGTGSLFAQWGLPTAESVVVCHRILPHLTLIGSGGVRNGIEVAKLMALGAHAAAFALPMLKAAEKSVDDAVLEINRVKEELKTAMFLVGAKNIEALRKTKLTRNFDFTSQVKR